MAFSAILSISAASILGEESSSAVGQGTFGVGYDEGLQVRVLVLDNVSAYASFAFFTKGADSVYHQPLNNISWKLGGEYVFKKWDKLNLGAFGEWRQEMQQGETERALGLSTLRYNQWNTIFRIGVRPEWFILDRLSIDYKFGIQYIHHGPTFKLNAAQNGVESNKNDYDEAGVYSGRSPFDFNKTSVLLNIGFTVYIAKLPFFK
jgi:hypothetical protein